MKINASATQCQAKAKAMQRQSQCQSQCQCQSQSQSHTGMPIPMAYCLILSFWYGENTTLWHNCQSHSKQKLKKVKKSKNRSKPKTQNSASFEKYGHISAATWPNIQHSANVLGVQHYCNTPSCRVRYTCIAICHSIATRTSSVHQCAPIFFC